MTIRKSLITDAGFTSAALMRQRPVDINPPPRMSPGAGSAPAAPARPPDTRSVPASIVNPSRRAKRKENGKEKKQPTGDYKVGYCAPPVATQFTGKPGPGRPRGSKNQDTILRELFDKKRKVTIGGKEQKLSQRELAGELLFKTALEGKNFRALTHVLGEAQRLYAAQVLDETAQPMSEILSQDREMMAMLSSILAMGDALPSPMTGNDDLPSAEQAEVWSDEQDWNGDVQPGENDHEV